MCHLRSLNKLMSVSYFVIVVYFKMGMLVRKFKKEEREMYFTLFNQIEKRWWFQNLRLRMSKRFLLPHVT